MNQEDIIRMAREANIKQAIETPNLLMLHELERFAALVAENERKVWVEKRQVAWHEGFDAGRKTAHNVCAAVAEWTPDATGTAHKIAAAIRARSEQCG